MPAPKGHARWGGLRRGYKFPKTLAKEATRERLRQLLTERLGPVADALVSRAQGVRYFVTRNAKTGKYELVTNPDQVVNALNGEDDQGGEFYTDKPDVQAIREILDRTIDKPKEQAQELNVNVSGELALAIAEGRRRASERNKKAE